MATDAQKDHPIGTSPREPGPAFQNPNPLEPLRLKVITALRDNQALVVLTSLSLVIGAFSQSVSNDAVSYAVSAATAFFISLILSILLQIHRFEDSSDAAILGGMSLIAIALGFILLGRVILEFTRTYALVGRVVGQVVGSFLILSIALSWGYALDAAQKVRNANPAEWKLRARAFTTVAVASLIAVVILIVWWGASLFWPQQPDWIAAVAIAALVFAFASLFYMTHVVIVVRKTAPKSSQGPTPENPSDEKPNTGEGREPPG